MNQQTIWSILAAKEFREYPVILPSASTRDLELLATLVSKAFGAATLMRDRQRRDVDDGLESLSFRGYGN